MNGSARAEPRLAIVPALTRWGGLATPPPGVATMTSQRRVGSSLRRCCHKNGRGPSASTTAVLPPDPTKMSTTVPRMPTVPAGVLILYADDGDPPLIQRKLPFAALMVRFLTDLLSLKTNLSMTTDEFAPTANCGAVLEDELAKTTAGGPDPFVAVHRRARDKRATVASHRRFDEDRFADFFGRNAIIGRKRKRALRQRKLQLDLEHPSSPTQPDALPKPS